MSAFLLCLLLSAAEEKDPFLKVGAGAPAFELSVLGSNTTFNLDSILKAHKYAFLIFWTTFCPDCLASMANMHDIPSAFDSLKWDIETVSINYDREDWDFVKQFAKKEKLNFPILIDKKGKLAFAYGTDLYNIGFFLVDKDKKVVWSFPDRPDNPKNAQETIIESIIDQVFPEIKIDTLRNQEQK